MSITATKITEQLFLMRSPAAGFDEAHALAEALHLAHPDDCKLALLEFCKDLLIASRNIAQLQIDAAETEAARDAGSFGSLQ